MLPASENWAWLEREARKNPRIRRDMLREAERAWWGFLATYRPPESA